MLRPLFRWFETRIETYPDSVSPPPQGGIAAFVWASTQGLRGWLLLLVLLTATAGLLEAMMFRFMGMIVDWLGQYAPDALWQEKGSSLAGMALLMGLLVLVRFSANTVRLQTLQGVFPMRLRWQFHRHMLNQSLAFYHNEFAGRIAAKVMQTALSVRDTVMILIEMLVHTGVYLLTAGAILAALDWRLVLPFILWVLVFGTLMKVSIPRVGRAAKAQADARSMMTGRITDAYSNIAIVKLFSHGTREADYAKDSMQEFMHTVHRQMRLATLMGTASAAAGIGLITLTTALGLVLWQQGAVGAGTVATAIAVALRVRDFSNHIMWESAHLFEHIGTVADGMATLSRPHTVLDAPDAPPLQVKQGEIRFENVSFHYDAARPLLENFNLTVKSGEKVGLIGRSGAGKSTLVNLLLRFYDAQNGRITIDGQNIAAVRQESLREHIGLVTQDTGLLHRSVRDNIVYGRPDANEDDMHRAAEQAEAAEFIARLSDPQGRIGYDAQVGDRGVKLSGGQRQRIAIARVMLKNAPILVLDEATSALDSEVENAIQSSLDKMMDGKTVIAIAHRLSTVAAMDRLVVLDEGRIVEEGTHAQLLEQNGLYAKLWAHQSGGFLPEQIE